VCIGLLAGCGGDSDPTPDAQVSVQVKQRADRLAATIGRLGSALDGADCDDAARIAALRDRMHSDSRRLTAYSTEPAFRDDIAGVRSTVGKIDAEIELLIQECRIQAEPRQP
jgi:hypothetical protein